MVKTVVVVCVAVLVVFYGFKILDDDGAVGLTKKPLRAPVFAVKGCFCHGDTVSPRVRAWISGPDSLPAGARALYKISVAKDSNIAAGFDVAAFYGDLGIEDTADTKLMRIDPNNPLDSLELTHTEPKRAAGSDTISWIFWYHAPLTVGLTDTLYADGNSVDTSLDPAGDYWNYAPNFLVRVTHATSVAAEPRPGLYRLFQNYPNPFNPATIIRYSLPVDAHVQLTVFDLTGKEVTTLVHGEQTSGMHEAIFSSDGRTAAVRQLSSGVYLYRLSAHPVRSSTANQFVEVKKMLFIK